jgi:hypothetical protein
MKKLLIILAVSILGMSCTKDITRFNEQTKNAAVVGGETLFSYGTKQYVDVLASPNVNVNVFRFTVGHWAATTYQDEPRYDFETRAIPDGLWSRMFRSVLVQLQEAKRLIGTDATLTADEKANKLAQCDIMQVCAYYFLTTTFGNVPYTEALDNNNLFPKYDDAKTIYGKLITRMQANVAALKTTANGISAGQDIIYGGNVALWKKFANSLLLRMAMTIADSDDATAKSIFVAANAGAFSSSSDNAQLKYLATTPNTNPIWVDLVQSGRQDMVAGKPLIDKLISMSDPRLVLYFRPNNNGDQVGGVIGSNNTFSAVSKPSAQTVDPTFPQILMGYSEVEFLRAEALERWVASIPGTADVHYANGVTASIVWWGGSAASAVTYLLRPDVAYATAGGTYKAKIGFQKWIALYNQPVQGWVEMRRLDQPTTAVVPAPVGAKSGYPTRLPYPQSEQVLNPDSYKAAAAAVGGDKTETKLWWDKF